MIKKTERGWAGHFICANRCRFRRNTLLEKGNIRIVVSSVGLMENWTGDPRQDKNIRGFETVGPNRYYETMAFHAEPAPSRYFDADVSREVHFAAPWYIKEVDADDKANAQHDAVVEEIATRMAAGEFDNLNDSITGGGTPYRPNAGWASLASGKDEMKKWIAQHKRGTTAIIGCVILWCGIAWKTDPAWTLIATGV